MSLVVAFPDANIARRCNRAAATEKTWGSAGRDVRESLCVLASSPSLHAYEEHPCVTNEGAVTVFKGQEADVLMTLDPVEGPPQGVNVESIDIRPHTSSTK